MVSRLRHHADRRILVVDDSAAVHARVQDLLEDLGFEEVYHAGSAQEAFTFYGCQRPDLVLVDMLMPGTDGAAFTRELLAQHPRARVVVVTALARDHHRVTEAVAHGALGVVTKPVSRETLATALQHALAA